MKKFFKGIEETVVSNAANGSNKMRSETGFSSKEVIGEHDNGGFCGLIAKACLKYFQKKMGEEFETVSGKKAFSLAAKERNAMIAVRRVKKDFPP